MTDHMDYPSYKLHRRVDLRVNTALSNVAMFPWSTDSLSRLWNGELAGSDNSDLNTRKFQKMVRKWENTIIVGNEGGVVSGRLCPPMITVVHRTRDSFSVTIPSDHDDEHSVLGCDVIFAWILRPQDPGQPFIVCSAGTLLYIIDVTTQAFVGCLRGHGRPITSIAVHPQRPSVIATSSRDCTTRIYDFTLRPSRSPDCNPKWPPSNTPSLGSSAHGLQPSEVEGHSPFGRCIIVLVGGMSGGHQGAVLCAAFHPDQEEFPLIATGGVDRCVKVWRIPVISHAGDEVGIVREDKPIFSSSCIHKARVLSVSWLNSETLITHSAPALARLSQSSTEITYQKGTIVTWRLLCMNRFFPPQQLPSKIVATCVSDFTESSSLKIHSVDEIPTVPGCTKADSTPLHVHIGPSPIAIFVFPEHLHLRYVSQLTTAVTVDTAVHDDMHPETVRRIIHAAPKVYQDSIEMADNSGQAGWTIPIPPHCPGEHFRACVMDRRDIILAVGDRGNLWVWKLVG